MVQPKHGNDFFDIGTVFQTVKDWVLKVSIRVAFGFGTAGNVRIFVVNYF